MIESFARLDSRILSHYTDTMNKVICADALEYVSELGQFDYVLTDPPYSVGDLSFNRQDKMLAGAMKMADATQRSLVCGVLRNVKKAPRFASWVFTDWRNISYLGFALKGMGLGKQNAIVWDKGNSIVSRTYRKRHEHIIFSCNFVNEPENYYGEDIVSIPKVKARDKLHPSEKPIEIVKALCGKCPPGRVLDPFCGSGALLEGAQDMGWEVVGIDLVSEFVDIANARLNKDKDKRRNAFVGGLNQI